MNAPLPLPSRRPCGNARLLLAALVAGRGGPAFAVPRADRRHDRAGRPPPRPVVILRGSTPSAAALRFHTDRRSAKFAELSADPRIALTGYDAAQKVQVRAEGVATLHTDDPFADAAWEASRSFSRICYGVEPGPGARLAEGGAFALPSADAEIAAGRANFCACVSVAVQSFEYLYLAHSGIGGRDSRLQPAASARRPG